MLSYLIKTYIEENVELLDEDPLEFVQEFLQNYYYYENDIAKFMDIVLNDLELLNDLEDAVKSFTKKIQLECNNIDKRMGASGLRPILSLNTSGTKPVTIQNIIEGSMRDLCITLERSDVTPDNIPHNCTIEIETDNRFSIVSQLYRQNESSAQMHVQKPIFRIKFADIYSRNYISQFLKIYVKTCEEVKDAINRCFKSFEWKDAAINKIAPEVLIKLNELSSQILGRKIYTKIEPDTNGVYIGPEKSLVGKTRLHLSCYINFNIDPYTIDIDKQLKDTAHEMHKLKRTEDKRAARTNNN